MTFEKLIHPDEVDKLQLLKDARKLYITSKHDKNADFARDNIDCLCWAIIIAYVEMSNNAVLDTDNYSFANISDYYDENFDINLHYPVDLSKLLFPVFEKACILHDADINKAYYWDENSEFGVQARIEVFDWLIDYYSNE